MYNCIATVHGTLYNVFGVHVLYSTMLTGNLFSFKLLKIVQTLFKLYNVHTIYVLYYMYNVHYVHVVHVLTLTCTALSNNAHKFNVL